MVKYNSSNKILNVIMKLRNFKIYKWIYRHPKISIAILILMAAIILYIFVGFIINHMFSVRDGSF
jgi:hypothetical protein